MIKVLRFFILSFGLNLVVWGFIHADPSDYGGDPIDNYCLSKAYPINDRMKPSSKNVVSKIKITDKNKDFFIVVDVGGNGIELLDEAEKVLSKKKLMQYEWGGLKELILGKNGWLFVDTGEIDYIVKIYLGQDIPVIDDPVALSNLTVGPCSKIGPLYLSDYVHCAPANGIYSHSLDRVFVTGHKPNIFGLSNLVTMEIVDGKSRSLSGQAEEYQFVSDLAGVNAALFRDKKHGYFVYDGKEFIQVISDYFKFSGYKYSAYLYPYVESSTGRVFFSNFNLVSVKPVFVEIKGGARILDIKIPKDFDGEWAKIFGFPGGDLVFVLSRKGLFVVRNDVLRRVVSVSDSSSVDLFYWDLETSSMIFSVKNIITGMSYEYSLTRRVSSKKCQSVLNMEIPVLIQDK